MGGTIPQAQLARKGNGRRTLLQFDGRSIIKVPKKYETWPDIYEYGGTHSTRVAYNGKCWFSLRKCEFSSANKYLFLV